MFNVVANSQNLQCPICQQSVPPGQFAGPHDIEPAARALIQSQHSTWQPQQGICPSCLQNVLNQLNEKADQLSTPFYGILPVGLRLGYNGLYNGSGVTIAFLDSGFSNHPDITGRVKLYVDASEPEVRELEEVEIAGDLSWHGTMTSVVAAGNGSLSGGLYRGLANGADLVLIRVSDSEGGVNEEGIGRGLGWVLTNARRFGIQIVNISLGGDQPNDYANNPIDLMVEALVSQGIVVVCAAGNAGERHLVPPASVPSAITVGGLDDKNTLDLQTFDLWHSNYGQTRMGVWKPELVAPSLWLAAPVLPGSSVDDEAEALEKLLQATDKDLPELLSSVEIEQHIPNLVDNIQDKPLDEARHILRQAWNGQKLISRYYQHVDGTSFAAPIVSSVVAQMLQANPGLSALGLKDLLLRTARYLPEVAPDQQGHGVIAPWAAVAAALTTVAR